MKTQCGYVNLDGIGAVFALALVGIVGIAVGIAWAIWWLINHIAFV